jgi:signal transduction histidine kinase
VDLCIREARQSILDLRSPVVSSQDLAASIRRTVDRQTRGTGVAFELSVTGTPRSCGPRVDQQLLRIAQEAVANAIRHARATHIRLDLSYDAAVVTLRVADNGRGFDPAEPTFAPEDHWGLANMKERADQIGAQFRLVSSPGAGTEIEIVVPIPPVVTAIAS